MGRSLETINGGVLQREAAAGGSGAGGGAPGGAWDAPAAASACSTGSSSRSRSSCCPSSRCPLWMSRSAFSYARACQQGALCSVSFDPTLAHRASGWARCEHAAARWVLSIREKAGGGRGGRASLHSTTRASCASMVSVAAAACPCCGSLVSQAVKGCDRAASERHRAREGIPDDPVKFQAEAWHGFAVFPFARGK